MVGLGSCIEAVTESCMEASWASLVDENENQGDFALLLDTMSATGALVTL